MRRVYFLKPLSSKSLFFGTDHTSRKEKKTVYIVIVYYSFFFFLLVSNHQSVIYSRAATFTCPDLN